MRASAPGARRKNGNFGAVDPGVLYFGQQFMMELVMEWVMELVKPGHMIFIFRHLMTHELQYLNKPCQQRAIQRVEASSNGEFGT